MPSKTISTKIITDKIHLIRGHKVLIDRDLAELYGVATKRLNEQVKRNRGRFPDDFMFRLNARERIEVVASCDHLKKLKFSPVEPFAFTEHGVIMAANILNSKRAIDVSLLVVRVFIKLREALEAHKELAVKLHELERKLGRHDKEIMAILQVVRRLIAQEERPKGKIGFHPLEGGNGLVHKNN